MDSTLKYYNQNADQFVQGTLSVDFKQTQDRFLAKLPEDAYILDFGCGSGRDTKYFLENQPEQYTDRASSHLRAKKPTPF